MADEPQVAAVGALKLQLGSSALQFGVLGGPQPVEAQLLAQRTPRASVGPPPPVPAGSVARSSESLPAPTV